MFQQQLPSGARHITAVSASRASSSAISITAIEVTSAASISETAIPEATISKTPVEIAAKDYEIVATTATPFATATVALSRQDDEA